MVVNLKKDKLSNFNKVKEFHRVVGSEYPDKPTLPTSQKIMLRNNLILEEVKEFMHEVGYDITYDVKARPLFLADTDLKMEDVAKELADIIYVVYGAADAYGIDLDKVFAEVHRSNMTKLDDNGKPIRREDGKILKGPNYTPADIKKVLDEQ